VSRSVLHWRIAIAAAVVLAGAATSSAQVYVGRHTPAKGSVELSGGGNYQGGLDLGNAPATLTRNPSTGAEPLVLFAADTSLGSGFGVQARVGYYLSSALAIEGGVQIVRPRLEVRLSDDFEGANDLLASESITSYLFTGSVLYHFGAGKGLKPFVIAGAGHVRDLHDGDELVETGLEYHAGGGIKSWFGTGRRKFGVRAEALVSFRDGGVGTEDERRTVPTAGFSLSYLF
jgi:hypothetical protein